MEKCDATLEKYMQGQHVEGLTDWESVKQSTTKEIHVYGTLQQILHGILYIHVLHEVHRDLSPHNGLFCLTEILMQLVLWLEGYWKIADFGLTSGATTTRLVTS